MVNRKNFYIGTTAVYKNCGIPSRPPDYQSPSHTYYWYEKDGDGEYVIRASNHWIFINGEKMAGRIFNYCKWSIINVPEVEPNLYLAGKCYFKDFIINKRKGAIK